ncbi:MAG: hypothetical protein IJU81_03470 [Bacteroidales bacterium]|nr:hypothetical protein [Bacteroidales bacterium]
MSSVTLFRWTFFAACAAVLSACGSVKMASQMRSLDKENPYNLTARRDGDGTAPSVPFEIRDSRILLPSTIDGVSDSLLLDLGYSGYLLGWQLDDSVDTKNLLHAKTLTGRGLETTYMHLEQKAVSNQLFDATNMLRMVLHYPKRAFEGGEPVTESTLLGCGFIDDKYLVLDFESNTMRLSDSVDTKGWVRLRSSRLGGYFVILVIDGKRYRCMLDTGNPDGLILRSDRSAEMRAGDKVQESYGIVGASGRQGMAQSISEGKTQLAVYRSGLKVVYGSKAESVVSNVRYDRSIAMHNAGLQFMRQFNWIIGKRGIYVKVIRDKVEPLNPEQLYEVSIVDGKLTIVSRWLGKASFYQLGAVITKVGGETVDESNIVRYRHLLNTTPDWSALAVETR